MNAERLQEAMGHGLAMCTKIHQRIVNELKKTPVKLYWGKIQGLRRNLGVLGEEQKLQLYVWDFGAFRQRCE